jgi:DNA helicase II / ATP-dependent DNA helicase PcrA
MNGDLNDEQLAAIGSTATTVIVPAGPGSGKSRTLVGRVKFRLAQGVEAKHIIILTFTNSGAHVFAERLHPIKVGFMGTVHGFCMRLIQWRGHLIGYRPGGVSIVTEEAKKVMLYAIREKLGRKISDKAMFANETPEANLIWAEYRHCLKRANMVDYDQILADGLELLRIDQVRSEMHVAELDVDETQDSGETDWGIYWAIPAATRFFVGDPDQSIYVFRGGKPELLTRLARGETGSQPVDVFTLAKNYRSDIQICDAATLLIRHNTGRLEKAVIPVSENLGAVRTVAYNHEGEEIYGVWGLVCRTMEGWNAQRSVVHGGTWDDIAILARTNSLVEKYRETLRGLGMPVKQSTAHRLPADWQFALTCIGLLIDPQNDFHAEALMRARGDTATKIQETKVLALRHGRSLAAVAGITERLADAPRGLMGALQTLVLLGVSNESAGVIRRRIEVLPNENATLPDLLTDLWRHDTWNEQDPAPGVTVSTIHSAKGREWDVVFVVAMEEGIFPHYSARDPDPEMLEEERRLAFVGVTRARHELWLTWARKRIIWYKEHEQEPSRFLAEMDL